jgi:ABC-type uncharacterized transport system permease subunit
MKALSQFVNYLLPVFYLAVLYVYYLVFTGRRKALEPKTTWFLAALLAMHILELTIRHLALRTIPLSSIHDAFTFLAFSIVLVYMVLETSLQNRGSGLFILSAALVLQLISTFNLSWEPETSELLSSPVFAVHASLSVMGYTALCLSAIYALMYLVQNHNLKKRNLGQLFSQLPALSYLEKMSRRSMLIGIVLLGHRHPARASGGRSGDRRVLAPRSEGDRFGPGVAVLPDRLSARIAIQLAGRKNGPACAPGFCAAHRRRTHGHLLLRIVP